MTHKSTLGANPKNSILSLGAMLLLSVGCSGENDRGDEPLSTWEKALEGVGGGESLESLRGFEIHAAGNRLLAGESFSSSDPVQQVSSFESTLSYDLEGDAQRVDWSRVIDYFGGAELSYSDIINGQIGYVDGDDNFLGAELSTAEMLSSRWAADRKQTLILNPQLLLREVLAAPSLATDGGVEAYEGAEHELLVIDDPIYPITLWINGESGRISKLSTALNDHLHRDVTLEVEYDDWQDFADGPSFPMDVRLLVNGQVTHEEHRDSVTINPEFAAERFGLPADAAPVYDEELARWGEANHQFHQNFMATGLPFDAPQTEIAPMELSPGVWVLFSSHNSMLIEQENNLVLIEPALYPERSRAVIDWAAGQFPDKPISHAVLTHHHLDHSGGAREYVAEGATIVMQSSSVDYMSEVFNAPSTVVPDSLERSPIDAEIMPVDAEAWGSVDDPTNPVEFYHVTTAHAEDMLMIYLPASGLMFNSDMWNPGMGALSVAVAQELRDAVDQWELEVSTLVGGHGGIGPLSELDDFLSSM